MDNGYVSADTVEARSVGQLLLYFQSRAALSQDELADISGVSARTISDLERGQRTTARLETVRMLANALQLSSADRIALIKASRPPLLDATLLNRGSFTGSIEPPAYLTSFVGRGSELAHLYDLLTEQGARLVTISGPGGVGKSRLAAAVAHQVRPHFSDRVAWIDLSTVAEPNQVSTTLLTSLGGKPSLTHPALATVIELIGNRHQLLVLDTFEHLLTAASTVGELVQRCPRLVVLCASRSRLRLACEVEFAIQPLELPAYDWPAEDVASNPAIQLFADRVGSVQPGFTVNDGNRDTVVAICRALEGLPLSIELAAARSKTIPLPDILERLASPLDLLSNGYSDFPERQQALKTTIAWSYHLLDAKAQRLLRMLSVFTGGASLLACEISLHPDADVLRPLESLVDHGLLTRSGNRYTMLDSIRSFAREELSINGEESDAEDALIEVCLRLTQEEDGFPSCVVPELWLQRLDAERENIRAAHRILSTRRQPARLLEFVASLGHYFYNRGPITEAWEWFEQAMDARDLVDVEIRQQGHYWASCFASHLGLIDECMTHASEALSLAQQLGDIEWEAASTHSLGIANLLCGNYKEAQRLFERQIALWQYTGRLGLSGFGYDLLGEIATHRGDLALARHHFRRAIEVFEEMGSFGWTANATYRLGEVAAREGDKRLALACFMASLDLAIRAKAVLVYRCPLARLSGYACNAGEYELAVNLATASRQTFEKTGRVPTLEIKHQLDEVEQRCRNALGTATFEEIVASAGNLEPVEWLSELRRVTGNIEQHVNSALPAGPDRLTTPQMTR